MHSLSSIVGCSFFKFEFDLLLALSIVCGSNCLFSSQGHVGSLHESMLAKKILIIIVIPFIPMIKFVVNYISRVPFLVQLGFLKSPSCGYNLLHATSILLLWLTVRGKFPQRVLGAISNCTKLVGGWVII